MPALLVFQCSFTLFQGRSFVFGGGQRLFQQDAGFIVQRLLTGELVIQRFQFFLFSFRRVHKRAWKVL